ncbi:MAG: hypothetical protein J7K69_08680 [Thermotogae bacterium]|nr:hypothetical protein [Thermotogota bacterium]
MLFKVSSNWLDRFLKIAEKLIGNVEPSFKRVNFYHKDSDLKAFITDGCIKFETPVPLSVVDLPYDFIVPLEPLRLILKDEKSDFVSFELKEKQVIISFGNQILMLPIPKKVDKWHEPMGDNFFNWKLSELIKILNIGSIVCSEGDYVVLNVGRDKISCFGSDGHHITVGTSGCETQTNNFIACIPYVSVRHMVKASESLKRENINVGLSKLGITILFGKTRLMLCYRQPEPFHYKLVEFAGKLISESYDDLILVKNSELKRAISKLCRFVKRETSLVNCLITKEIMELSAKGEGFYYSFKVPLFKRSKQTVILKFSPMKVRRFLSKSFSEESIFELVRRKYVILKRKRGDLYMIMKTEKVGG